MSAARSSHHIDSPYENSEELGDDDSSISSFDLSVPQTKVNRVTEAQAVNHSKVKGKKGLSSGSKSKLRRAATPHPSKSHSAAPPKLKIWTARELDAHMKEVSGGAAMKPSARELRYIARSTQKEKKVLSSTRHNIPKSQRKKASASGDKLPKLSLLPDPPSLSRRNDVKAEDFSRAPESAFRTPVGMCTFVSSGIRVKKEEGAEMGGEAADTEACSDGAKCSFSSDSSENFLDRLLERHIEKLFKLSSEIDEIVALEHLVDATCRNLPLKQIQIRGALFRLNDFLHSKLSRDVTLSRDITLEPKEENDARAGLSGRENPLGVILEESEEETVQPTPPQKIVYGRNARPTRGALLQMLAQQSASKSARRNSSKAMNKSMAAVAPKRYSPREFIYLQYRKSRK